MTAHVVVGADDSPSSRAAVAWAAADAARRGRALRIVHVREPWTYDIPLQTPPGFRDSMTGYCQGVLDTAADLARERAPGIEVETVLETGRIAEVLQREAEDAEEVVVGNRGLGGFTGLLLGSVSLALAGHVNVPVVVVRGSQERTYDEVVVGFDGSTHSAAALEYAFEEATRRGARLHAIHTWQMPVMGQGATAYPMLIEELMETERRVAADTLTPWRGKYPQIEVEETAVCGHPVAVICEASVTADLVVVGSRSLGRLGSAVLGSVSHGVLHHAHCPVAVVRARGEA
ncbi:nucleotide-binding universal stress UspA family protein [Streptosporangium album]|uniref:Nucleotide-binding universal stress UspA family protein n=1 Tax=Streptosporangium album TaxID=47479 RepID=A0A7W7WDM4_9ACTN|nr:universal stress protein [Streptosporangium album]MBB4942988.1 nucleotide-binding universal stress UspA family protein [Streptosporangium album]